MQIKCAAIKGFIVLCIAFLTNHQTKSAQRVQPKGFVQHAYVKLNAFLIKHFAEHASDQSVSSQKHVSDQSASSQKIDFLHFITKDRTTNPNSPLTVEESKQELIDNYQKKIKEAEALFAQYTLRSAIKDVYFWGSIWALSSATYLHPNFKNQSFSRQGYWVAGSYAIAAAGTIAFRQFILKPIAEFNCAQNTACFNQKIEEIKAYSYDPNKYECAE